MPDKDEWYEYTGDDEPSKDFASYADFYPCDLKNAKGRKLYLMPKLLSGSDYSGSLVEVSNHRVFWNTFKRCAGVHDVQGGYGTFGVAIREDVYNGNGDLRETLERLDGYPLLDEDDHLTLEVEKEGEAWGDWVKHDFIRLVRGAHPTLEEWEPNDDESEVEELFRVAQDEANEYWEDDGGSMYIRLEKIVPYAVDHMLLQRTPADQLLLLADHSWASDKLAQEYEQRLKGTYHAEAQNCG